MAGTDQDVPGATILRRIIEQVPDFVILIDREGKARYMNRVAEDSTWMSDRLRRVCGSAVRGAA